MGVGQLQPKRDPDIARSDCPVPHLGQRCRVHSAERSREVSTVQRRCVTTPRPQSALTTARHQLQ